jgi:hypothetical protein
MIGLVIVLWIVYLSECFVRWTPGCWVFRPRGLGAFQGVSEPDVTFFTGRVGLVWTSVLPWRLAYRFPAPHEPLVHGQQQLHRTSRLTLVLQVSSTILFGFVMLVFPALLWMEMFVPLLPALAAAVLTAWVCTLVCYFLTHRRIFGHLPALESSVMATLSPLTLMRAPTLITIDAASSSHPAFAADALCDDEEFLRIARLWHYDEPEVRKELERVAARRGHKGALTSPPSHSEDDVSVYCPRCHATSLLTAVTCTDCDDVKLLPLPNARRAGTDLAVAG